MDLPDLHEQPVHVRRAAHVVTAADDRIETAAQVLHQRRHRAGTAPVCGECRDDARAVAEVLAPEVGRCGASSSGLRVPLVDRSSCELPAGHAGFHRDGQHEWGRMWVDPPEPDEAQQPQTSDEGVGAIRRYLKLRDEHVMRLLDFWETKCASLREQRDGLRTELLTTQQLLAHAERQRDAALGGAADTEEPTDG